MKVDIKEVRLVPYSRRQFLIGLAALGTFSIFPWVISCKTDSPKLNIIQLGKHSQMAYEVLHILFPTDNFGPSSKDIFAYNYLNWILSDTYYDTDIKKSILAGFDHLAVYSRDIFNQKFELLSQNKKETLISLVATEDWGERFLSRLVSILIDALVVSPIYGVNQNEVGWKWLSHVPGQPQANARNKYVQILERKHEDTIISSLSDLM